MYVLFASMHVRYVSAWCQWALEEDIGFPGTGVTNGWEPPWRC